MDWTKSLYEGMPDDPESAAEAVIANTAMANTLWSFFSALCAAGFREEYAYGLTLTYFEGIWNNTDAEEDGRTEDDCK